MSLFENNLYSWRETFFVLFEEKNRPSTEATRQAILSIGGNYEISDLRESAADTFDAMTVISPDDCAAMDLTFISGEEVKEHVAELKEEFSNTGLTDEERTKLETLDQYNARFDVFHFEQLVDFSEEEDEFMDPGTVLLVLEKLAALCQGVAIDPQSSSIM